MPTRLAPQSRPIQLVGTPGAAPSSPGAPGPLTIPFDEQAALLRLACVTLAVVTGQASSDALGLELELAARHDAPAAVFVTLTEAGELRGCMGSLTADRPIAEAVVDAACAAAQVDPRFRPLAARELPWVRVGISVLGPPVPLRTPADLRPGVDGVIVERHWARALLLPEVAERFHWGGREMVEAACKKAGLPVSAWRDPQTRLSVFRTAHFEGPAVEAAA